MRVEANFVWDADDNAWLVDVPSIQGCHTFGDTFDHAVEAVTEAIELCFEVDMIAFDKIEVIPKLSEEHEQMRLLEVFIKEDIPKHAKALAILGND